MVRTFFVQIEGEDPIVVAVKDDVNIIGKLILAKNTTFSSKGEQL